MKKLAATLGVLIVLGLVTTALYVSRRNEMVRKNEAVRAAWAEVDVQLQRRADLIPNLVETVRAYAAHEQRVFDDVANARSALLAARSPSARMAANTQLDAALGRLLALVENYPQLRANENFLRLQDELAGTENRIAVARRRYNEALRDYNAYIGTFPNNLFARWAGFSRNDAYWETSAAARQAPRVEFPR